MTRKTLVTLGRVASLLPLLLVACGESSERDGACPAGTHEDHGTCVADTLADAATDSVVQPPADAATDSVVQPPADAATDSLVQPPAVATTDKPADEGACPEVNDCGGCSALAHALGEPCGTGGSYVCNGTDDVTCETSAAPPAQAAGYHLVFADEFDTLDMSPNKLGDCKWYRAIPTWDLGDPPAANIAVANSALTLTWTQDQGTYLTAVSTHLRQGRLAPSSVASRVH